MSYWHTVLSEVLHKEDKNRSFLYTNAGQLAVPISLLASDEMHDKPLEKRDLRTYYLGADYPDVYFTKREAETAFWIVHGLTLAETAAKMYLSARTIEFYVKKMKIKLNCGTKRRLIDIVKKTDLIQILQSEGMRIVLH